MTGSMLPQSPNETQRRPSRLSSTGDESSAPDRHNLMLVVSDEFGVVVLCACEEWGYAGPNNASAWIAFQEHVEEANGQAHVARQ